LGVIGRLSDQELLEDIGPFIKGPKIRLHNNLLMALVSNITRDAPQVDVATWVSASDKPSSVMKLPAGDINERQLKKEIMAISARERKRIKEVPEKVSETGWGRIEMGCADVGARARMRILRTCSTMPSWNIIRLSRSSRQSLRHAALPSIRRVSCDLPSPELLHLLLTTLIDWESEIKQRYMLPLASETGEFPDVDNTRLRMLPICYEEGIPGGCTVETANFMNAAAETFVKEILTTIISRVRSNGPNYVQTDTYRKLAPKGRWIPRQERPLLGMHDVRLSLTLGDNLLTQMPTSMKKIMAGGWYERDYEVDTALQFEDANDVGEWKGGAPEDRKELKGLLDDCLALGT